MARYSRRLVVAFVSAAVLTVLAPGVTVVGGQAQAPASATPGQQAPPAAAPGSPVPPQDPAQQPPVFRAGVKLVRVDVTAIGRENRPVEDLRAEDFEVEEDGQPQTVTQVQFVQLSGRRPEGDDTSIDIRTQTQAEAEAARDDVRVIGVFLDDYHIDKAPDVTIPLRNGLMEFARKLWPTDLVAVMEPLTPLSALRFTRSQPELLKIFQEFEGRQGELFPVKGPMEEAQWARGNVRRVRAEVSLSALAALTIKLGGLKEGRKTILYVSQGPPVFLGPMQGNLQDEMRNIVDAAHRGNVTIYALDPRTLGSDWRMGVRDTLYQLTGETGGRAIVNTNDFTSGLGRMLSETSAYYVIGYTPTRVEDDGKFHKISVKVRRSGVRVLARQGYWAPSAKEIEAAAEAAARTPEPGVANALASASDARASRRLAHVWLGFSRESDGRTGLSVAWEPLDVTADPFTLDATVLPATGEEVLATMSSLAATAPGKYVPAAAPVAITPGAVRVRFVAKSAGGVVMDDWTVPLSVPDLTQMPISLSTPRAARARTFQEWRALQAEAHPQPAAVWQFRRTERVTVMADCYGPADGRTVEAHVLSRAGKELTALAVPAPVEGRIRFELPVNSFGQGTYLLRLRMTAGGQTAEQVSAFQIAQ